MRDEKWKRIGNFSRGPTPLKVVERLDLEIRCRISAKETSYCLSSWDGRRGLNMSGLRFIRCRRIEMA
jgi:hypothetical protein